MLSLSGCARTLSGTYEAITEVPDYDTTGLDEQTKIKLDRLAKSLEDTKRMTLTFSGSIVSMGSLSGSQNYEYKAKGDRLEIYADLNGHDMTMTLQIEEDGSLLYHGLHFRRIDVN